MIIFYNPQKDFAQINRVVRKSSTPWKKETGAIVTKPSTQVNHKLHGRGDSSRSRYQYVWQRFPHDYGDRVRWLLDLLTSTRGQGWNWRVAGLPPLPKDVKNDLDCSVFLNSDYMRTNSRVVNFNNARDLLRYHILSFVFYILLCDFTSTMMLHDPWVLTRGQDMSPPSYLPANLQSLPQIVKLCRLSLCLFHLEAANKLNFNLASIFWVGILGPVTANARGEPWMNVNQFGQRREIFRKGLAGYWSKYWHQTLRVAVTTPAKKIVQGLGLESRALEGIIAFSLSGFLHACVSGNVLGMSGVYEQPMFFILQAVGISLQTYMSRRLSHLIQLPLLVRQIVNFTFALGWLYITGPIFCHNFAKAGLWMLEILPISLFRGPLRLGLPEDTRWWRWNI